MLRIKCMLSDAKLPKSFWAKAIHIAVDLINLSPLVPLREFRVKKIFFINT